MAGKSIHPWCAYKHVALGGRVLYVGKGRLPRAADLAPSRRSAYHLNAIKKHCPKVLLIAVQPFATENEAFNAERQWIADAKAEGHKLCNFTEGGEGTSGRVMSPEAREKIRRATIRQWDQRGRRQPKSKPSGVASCTVCRCDIPWVGRPKLVCSKRCESAYYRKPAEKRPRKPGASGVRGVYPANGGKWKAGVTLSATYRHLGTFATKEEASAAIRAAKCP